MTSGCRYLFAKFIAKARAAATKVAAAQRARPREKDFAAKRRCAAFAVRRARKVLAVAAYWRRRRACKRLGKFGRGCVRNKRLRRQIDAVFGAASSAGAAVDPSDRVFDDDPWKVLSGVRDRTRHFFTACHAAADGGNLSLMALVVPHLAALDFLAKDASGDTPLHRAAARAKPDVCRALARGLDAAEAEAPLRLLRRRSLFGVASARKTGRRASGFVADGHKHKRGFFSSSKKQTEEEIDVVLSGWMTKRKEGDAWKKRWVVLKEGTLSHAAPAGNTALRSFKTTRSNETLWVAGTTPRRAPPRSASWT